MNSNTPEITSIDLRGQLDQLGLVQPDGWAFLPSNIFIANSREELTHADSVLSLRKLMRVEGLVETPIEPPELVIPRLALRYTDWVGPIVLFSSSFISENPHMVGLCLNVISNYVYDLFRGRTEEVQARLKIVIEGGRGCPAKLVEYKGNVAGLKDLPKIIKSLHE